MDDEDEDLDLEDTPRRRATRSGGRARGRRPRRAAAPEPKLKYMLQLQDVANRERDSVTIELDDLKAVGFYAPRWWRQGGRDWRADAGASDSLRSLGL